MGSHFGSKIVNSRAVYHAKSFSITTPLNIHIKNKIALAFLLLNLALITTVTAQSSNPNLDTALATKLHADDYGMKKYTFVILKTGDNKTNNKNFIDSCFKGHMSNMQKLVDQNKLVVAGPFLKNDANFRGLFILTINNPEEAQAVLDTDPAIHAQLLKAELYPWYGSAALSEYLPYHDKIWKINP